MNGTHVSCSQFTLALFALEVAFELQAVGQHFQPMWDSTVSTWSTSLYQDQGGGVKGPWCWKTSLESHGQFKLDYFFDYFITLSSP